MKTPDTKGRPTGSGMGFSSLQNQPIIITSKEGIMGGENLKPRYMNIRKINKYVYMSIPHIIVCYTTI